MTACAPRGVSCAAEESREFARPLLLVLQSGRSPGEPLECGLAVSAAGLLSRDARLCLPLLSTPDTGLPYSLEPLPPPLPASSLPTSPLLLSSSGATTSGS